LKLSLTSTLSSIQLRELRALKRSHRGMSIHQATVRILFGPAANCGSE
jgi:hypothetical protein